MDYTTADNWHYIADSGYYFKKGDTVTGELYLGKFDSIDNWELITEEEKKLFDAEQEIKRLKEELNSLRPSDKEN